MFQPLASPLVRLIAGAILTGAALVASPAHASTPPWSDAPYSYYANNTSLGNVLRDFAGNFSLALQLSPQVQGTVNGRFNAQNPTEFLNRLGSVYGLNWFTYAGTLYVSRTTELTTRTITAGGSSIAAVRDALTNLGVLDPRFGWGELPEQGLALLSGPPAYVALVERTMQTLPLMAGGQQVAIFRLKHASVDDRTIMYRDQQIVIPGLAHVLRDLINGGTSSGSTRINNAMISSIAPLRTSDGLPYAANLGAVTFDPAGSGTATGPAASPYGTASGTGVTNGTSTGRSALGNGAAPEVAAARRLAPSIQADSRLNALIIQDTPDRIPLYQALVEQLDIPSPLIEIEATIIDVNSTKLSELGITNTSLDTFSTVMSAHNLRDRIRALETAGDAKIQSAPSIMTLDNIGALLDLSETFYVRTIGERVATVTPITAGTTLRVTPHLVDSQGGPVIQLDVDIEDGQIQETTVDTLPTVRRSNISTQTIIGAGQTLLLGGYNNQLNLNQTKRIPILGSIPLIGFLFSNRVENQQSRERLFMISPRLANVGANPMSVGGVSTNISPNGNRRSVLTTYPALTEASAPSSSTAAVPSAPVAETPATVTRIGD